MRSTRLQMCGVAIAAAVLSAFALTGCDPTRGAFAVTTEAGGADDVAGDGVCASAAAGGACTLQAAIEEANATPAGADITVPSGTYGGFSPTITKDVTINGDQRRDVGLYDMVVTVAAGAKLDVDGIRTAPSNENRSLLRFDVYGLLILDHASVVSADLLGALFGEVRPALIVRPGGSAGVSDSYLQTLRHASDGQFVRNDGQLILNRSTVQNLSYSQIGLADRTAIHTGPSGVTAMKASTIHGFDQLALKQYAGYRCTGTPPQSHGSVHLQESCGGTAQPTDSTGPVNPSTLAPLVDAIPVGGPDCDGTTTDALGTVRGNDGNGDGVPGCDIGAYERVP